MIPSSTCTWPSYCTLVRNEQHASADYVIAMKWAVASSDHVIDIPTVTTSLTKLVFKGHLPLEVYMQFY